MRWQSGFLLALISTLLLSHGCSQEGPTRPRSAGGGDWEANLSTLGKVGDSLVPGRYIVVLAGDDVDAAAQASALGSAYGIAVDHVFETALKGFAGRISDGVADRLRRLPQVASVEPERRLGALAQVIPTGADRIEVDLSPTAAIDGQPTLIDVDVAVIDTGLDVAHPDLNVVGGVRILNGIEDPDFQDDFGHGTHVGGIVAARDDAEGIVGVAPGARLWGVKVLDGWGVGLLSDLIAGVDWVAARAGTIEVATLCLGGTGYSPALHAAVQNCVGAGVVMMAAAGNGAQDVFGADGVFGTGDDVIPADLPDVATVTAFCDADGRPGGLGSPTLFGPDDAFAAFSNFARNVLPDNPVQSPGGAVDLLLPGVQVRSTIPGGGYYSGSGTSAAAAHGAGLAALFIAEHGRAADVHGVRAIRQALIDNAVPQDSPAGLAVLNDPDPRKEPIGWAIPQGPFPDVAITAFTGPASVLQGESFAVTASIANLGSVDVATPFRAAITEQVTGRRLVLRTIAALPAGIDRSATLTFTVPDSLSPGFYTLVCAHDFPDPVPANDRLELAIEVRSSTPPGENLGVYFDTAASLTQVDGVELLDHVAAYILYNEPTLASVRGFECGIGVVLPGGGSQINTTLSVTYPIPATDIGNKVPAEGIYNFITGFAFPLSATDHTVLATLDILFLEPTGTALDFYLGPSDPESPPAVGLPTLVREDFSEYKVAMATDPLLPAMQINGVPALPGTVTIDADPDSLNAPWELVLPGGSTESGSGDQTLTGMAPGSYTLNWLPVEGWTAPGSETLTLVPAGTIHFVGAYTEISSDQEIGLFFDTAGTLDTVQTQFLDQVPFHVLYLQPELGSCGGFEAGFDLGRLSGTTFNTYISMMLPVPGLNVGVNDPARGVYNYIVGYQSPLPVSGATVLATLNALILDQENLTADLRGSIPSSVDGVPGILTPDYQTVVPVGMPTAPGVRDLLFDLGAGDPAPAAPANLIATGSLDSPARVVLDWNNNTEPDLAGYNVHRSLTAGGPYARINTGGLVPASSYQDLDVSLGVTYHYVVTAVDDGGNESLPSAEAHAVPGDSTPPAVPVFTQAIAGDGQVDLRWTASGEIDFDHYNLYRGTVNGGPYGLIASPAAAQHLDTSVTNGTTYYYVVCSVDASGNESGQSAPIAATPATGLAETMGIFFDAQGTLTEVQAGFLDHVAGYVVYADPSLPVVRGFECGIDVATALKGVQINSSITASYPVPATDVGNVDPATGTYNFIAGYGEPLPTAGATVLAELDIFYLDLAPLEFRFRPSDPESPPANGLPAVIRNDYTIYEVAMASDPTHPAMVILPEGMNTGTITVDPDPDALEAPWQLQGPGGLQTGNGDVILQNQTAGSYTVTWLPVVGYDTPPPETLSLIGGQTIVFVGTYTPASGFDEIGLWFDPQALTDCAEVNFLDHLPAYILYSNPTIASTRGFEFGFDLSGAGVYNTAISVTYPVSATDVGTVNQSTGTYNYIVGYGFPIPTAAHTVMATLDIFYLDMGVAIRATSRGSIPTSNPITGLPMILKEDFSLLEADIRPPFADFGPAGTCVGP
ncbi:MAG: S8 family serine peptidase [bacterium]